jgi:hypothetical protein
MHELRRQRWMTARNTSATVFAKGVPEAIGAVGIVLEGTLIEIREILRDICDVLDDAYRAHYLKEVGFREAYIERYGRRGGRQEKE